VKDMYISKWKCTFLEDLHMLTERRFGGKVVHV
jgi:hypothetical protein